ncbi:L,D-transpeptidase family protein, partial [Pseudomonas aeruginosa]
TPKGFYWFDGRRPSNTYISSMHMSFPTARKVAKTLEKYQPAGGMLMNHGTPLDDKYPEWYFYSLDWTIGFIVMNNTDMLEVWS